jgi:pyruvate/2-oxoglutarate dehydrogenase complex dihydrolipoamide acyltransferase (E2) component
MALVDIQVPDIGDFDEVAVIELLVKPGDTVKAEQSLLTVESDKASMEIPSSHAGVVKELKVKLGDKVKQGSVIVVLEAAASSNPPPLGEGTVVAAAPAPAPTAPPPQPAPSGAGTQAVSTVEVRVPNIGDFKDVAVIELLAKPGDTILAEQSLLTVESDKASMEIPSSSAGVLKELRVKMGDKVNIGDVIALMEVAAALVPAAAAVAAAPAPATAPATATATAPAAPVAASQALVSSAPAALATPAHQPGTPAPGLPHASPSVRKFARELGVPLAELQGSGPKGRITQDDVQNFTRAVMAGAVQTQAQAAKAPPASGGDGAGLGLIPWPKVDFAKFGPIERREMSRIKKISGANLLRNAVMIPAVTNHDDADITGLGSLPRGDQPGQRKKRRQSHHAGFSDQGLRGGAQKIPGVQQQPRWRCADLQAVLAHWFCRRHAQRLDGSSDQGCRPKRHLADQPRDGRAGQEGARGQAQPSRDERRNLHHLQPWRHRWSLFHAHHQCARGGDPGRLQEHHGAGVEWQGVCASPDVAAVADLGPSGHRWRGGGAL